MALLRSSQNYQTDYSLFSLLSQDSNLPETIQTHPFLTLLPIAFVMTLEHLLELRLITPKDIVNKSNINAYCLPSRLSLAWS